MFVSAGGCRSAAEANNTVAVGKAGVEQSVLEREVATLQQQVGV
jgi:hypothetical protein